MEVSANTWVRSSLPEAVTDRAGILALDTATDRAVIVLNRRDGQVFHAPIGASRQHGKGLVPAIRDLLQLAALEPGDIAAIGVGLGPGSFTGLRIGLTAAKTLAYAIGCKLVGFDSLEAIAQGAPSGAPRISAALDAQRGDLFVADFERAGERLKRIGDTRLERVESWPSTLPVGTFVVGPTLGRAEPPWPEGLIRVESHAAGAGVLFLTEQLIMRQEFLDPWFLEPTYVRRSAAEEKAWPSPEPSR